MLDPRVLPAHDKGPVHGYVVFSHLAEAEIELEDQATEDMPGTVSLRIGDEVSGVLLQGDIRTVQRIVIEADRLLAQLMQARASPAR